LLDTRYTVVTAPFAGIASKTPEVGQYVNAGESVMSIVADRGAWVEANFKETDLAHIRENQAVEVKVDAYPDHVWRGTVQSFSQATGSEFSVLPAQNASGNWVKVVQRVPVRIALENDTGAPVLRAGMSTDVEIDTGHTPKLPGAVLSAVGWIDGLFNVSAAHAEERP
jgi:membrane fusion protein (multidrug efflux system)